MTIGLIILGIAAVLIFFGAAERYFELLGITGWLAFLVIISLVLGAVVPAIEVGSVSISIGGVVVPIIVSIILIAVARKSGSLVRAIPTTVVCAAAVVGIRLIFRPDTADTTLVSSLLIGFAVGALAFVINNGRVSVLLSAISSIVIGDIISSLIMFSMRGAGKIIFGGYGTFDAMIISWAAGLALFELINALKSTRLTRAARANLNTEAAEDFKPDGNITEKAASANAEIAEDEEVTTEDAKKILDYLDE